MEQPSFHTVKEVFRQVPLADLPTKMHSNRFTSTQSLALTRRSNPNARGGFDVHACCCIIPNLLHQRYSGGSTKQVGSSRQAHLIVQNCSSDSDLNVVCEVDSAR
jgi:hypothetical protein